MGRLEMGGNWGQNGGMADGVSAGVTISSLRYHSETHSQTGNLSTLLPRHYSLAFAILRG